MNVLKFALILMLTRIKQVVGVVVAILKQQVTRYPISVLNLEKNFSEYIGTDYCLTFCNGTSSIEAALFAAGVQAGDEVIVPSCTFHASIDPIVNVGAIPIFADIDLTTFNISPEDIANKITERTKAIIVVHLFGNPVDIAGVRNAVGSRCISIIEDASHAHGAKVGDDLCGSIGDFGAFSFQGDKAIAGGEGGAVVTNDRSAWIKMSMWGHFNRHANIFSEIGAEEFNSTGLGYKRRMAPLSAILAGVELKYIDKKTALFRKNVARLDATLDNIKGISVSKEHSNALKGGLYTGYPIFIEKGKQAAINAIKELRKEGIVAISWPFPLHHKMGVYADSDFRESVLQQDESLYAKESVSFADLKNTELIYEQGIVLSKRYMVVLNSRSLAKIRGVLERI